MDFDAFLWISMDFYGFLWIWDHFLRKSVKSRDFGTENHGISGTKSRFRTENTRDFDKNPVCGLNFPGFQTEIPFYEWKSRDCIPQIPGFRPEDRLRTENHGIPGRQYCFRIENHRIWMKIWWESRALDENIGISTPKEGFPNENPGLRSSGMILNH